MLKNSDLPAIGMDLDAAKEADEGYYNQHAHGLTKREHFAAMAMQGLMSCAAKDTAEAFARASVEMADALLEALENDNG